MDQSPKAKQILSDLSNNLPAALFTYIVDKDGNDKVQYINDGCYKIWGVQPEQVLNDASILWDIIHPEDIERMISSIQKSAQNLSKWECEWRITPHNDSKTKWLRGYGTPRESQDGSIVWNSVILDVTEEQQAKNTIERALRHTIDVLISALEARDPYTAGHGKNVAKIASKIATKMGLPAQQIEGIRLGGLIHDVGKISTPAEILTKPTSLLEAEYALIKMHPVTGGTFFNDVNLNWPIKDMVEQHHERMDGSGYPKGLEGEDICLEARVIAVADVADSMATNRPYRFAPGLEEALVTLKAGSGVKFDANVVNAFIELVEAKELTL